MIEADSRPLDDWQSGMQRMAEADSQTIGSPTIRHASGMADRRQSTIRSPTVRHASDGRDRQSAIRSPTVRPFGSQTSRPSDGRHSLLPDHRELAIGSSDSPESGIDQIADRQPPIGSVTHSSQPREVHDPQFSNNRHRIADNRSSDRLEKTIT